VTDISPVVSVPVLSNTTVSTSRTRSNTSPPSNKTPFFAPIVVPTIVAAGVARPSAQGQAIRTAEANTRTANSIVETVPPATTGPPAIMPTAGIASVILANADGKANHNSAQRTALMITAGTKYAEMRSANC